MDNEAKKRRSSNWLRSLDKQLAVLLSSTWLWCCTRSLCSGADLASLTTAIAALSATGCRASGSSRSPNPYKASPSQENKLHPRARKAKKS